MSYLDQAQIEELIRENQKVQARKDAYEKYLEQYIQDIRQDEDISPDQEVQNEQYIKNVRSELDDLQTRIDNYTWKLQIIQKIEDIRKIAKAQHR